MKILRLLPCLFFVMFLGPRPAAIAGAPSPIVEGGGARCNTGDEKCLAEDSAAPPLQSPALAQPPAVDPASPVAATHPAGEAAIPGERTAAAVTGSAGYALPLLGAYRKTVEVEDQVFAACDKYGVPRALARAVCMYESGGDSNLTSGAGARGYFQVMPPTFRLMRVPTNIEAGVKYLGQMLSEFGREDEALAAYNGGPGRVSKHKPMPVESLQYVVGVGIYHTLIRHEEDRIRAAAGRLLLHRLEPGETWESLSAATGVPILDLRLYNAHLAVRPLKPGVLIAHPPAEDGGFLGGPAGAALPTAYETRRGDNYLLLGLALNLDLDQLRRDNGLWRVQVPFEGMRLVLSPAPAARSLSAGTSVAAALGFQRPEMGDGPPSGAAGTVASSTALHKVKPGETLTDIATIYGVSVDSIRKTNRLRRARVRTGQVLRIPTA